MDWKTYENEIYVHLSILYPGASISRNVKLLGVHTARTRQIDVLIEDQVAGFRTRVVVDGKYFARRVDVRHVESFIGLLEDVGATHGLMVTPHGYSKAAMRRAQSHTQDVVLDVLDLSELRDYQGLCGVPYSGKKAMWINAPFGWVVDNSQSDTFVAALYQRGRTQKEARRANEWMYVNYWHKDRTCPTLAALLRLQTENMQEHYGSVRTCDFRGPERADGRLTWVRVATYDNVPFKEITGYVDGEGVVAFFVLFTVPELEATNMRKLMHVLRYSVHVQLAFRNEEVITALMESIESVEDAVERASGYTQIAIWYAEMEDKERAIQFFRRSFCTSPTVYRNFKPLISAELEGAHADAAAECARALFRLDPANPRVMQDILGTYESGKYESALNALVRGLMTEHAGDSEAEVNIAFHHGLRLVETGHRESAIQTLLRAQRVALSISADHPALAGIGETLAELSVGGTA